MKYPQSPPLICFYLINYLLVHIRNLEKGNSETSTNQPANKKDKEKNVA
jgi:hypothetical protein